MANTFIEELDVGVSTERHETEVAVTHRPEDAVIGGGMAAVVGTAAWVASQVDRLPGIQGGPVTETMRRGGKLAALAGAVAVTLGARKLVLDIRQQRNGQQN